ncbi:hypothetical protein AHAS_Ahas15G0372100 [Arachis hypogaea]
MLHLNNRAKQKVKVIHAWQRVHGKHFVKQMQSRIKVLEIPNRIYEIGSVLKEYLIEYTAERNAEKLLLKNATSLMEFN